MRDELKSYIEKCHTASNRTRYVLITIIITSVLCFSSFWNSRQDSWLNRRLEITKEAIRYKVWNIYSSKDIDSLSFLYYKNAREYAIVRNMCDSISLTERLNEIQKLQAEGVNTVQVTFLGVSYDINDLGLLGGFTFLVLLIWFQFSLMSELRNYKLTFYLAEGIKEKSLCYALLSMHQVLTIPTIKGIEPKSILNKTPLALLFLPLLVQGVIFYHDIRTYYFGKTISEWNTYLSYGGSLLFLICILFLTIKCVGLFNSINHILNKHRT